MTADPLELEGTWEEIIDQGEKLAGKRVRVIVLSDQAHTESPHKPTSFPPRSTAQSLLKYAGTWEGDDLEECLRLVYENRSEVAFE